ncbi:rifin PIR protein, putative [Plasmodium reichenowi]|uniref:Rifin PIR protein, putative n=1 Tax=Plasmodium reichenowi TaxID=5854 RepID=A0A2P9DHE2_PLARE|nr:rifin PIR protein, putative [Plasmodium reichenowi]
MKLYYSKILLFFLTLNILLTSYHAYNNKNKPSITPHHTPTTTSRVLSECDTESSIYDNDEEMKSVKESFDRQTSQRFEEYEERMKDKRQKRKEERDKNIQEIIKKDKMEKSLAGKIEKGCLRCGCGLGGVAASVGIFGSLGIYGWKSSALAAAAEKGAEAGIAKAITEVITKFGLKELKGVSLKKSITSSNFNKPMFYVLHIQEEYNTLCSTDTHTNNLLCSYKISNDYASMHKALTTSASEVATKASEEAVIIQEQQAALGNATSSHLYSVIGYSVLAILIIALVMIIIYLVLRYRRKKKMNKKAQYTKLLNQ